MTHIKRFDLINALIKKRNYKSYLEIGICLPTDCFDNIGCEKKVGVEPFPRAHRDEVFVGTSDEFFMRREDTFDIIFIDGLHKDFQVMKDYENALERLNEGGIILSHDNLPGRELHMTEEDNGTAWFGTGWRATARLRMDNPDVSVRVLDTDCGLGIVEKGSQDLYEKVPHSQLNFDFYIENRVDMLNIISTFDFVKDEELDIDCSKFDVWDGSPFI